jgi:hypothetical protein
MLDKPLCSKGIGHRRVILVRLRPCVQASLQIKLPICIIWIFGLIHLRQLLGTNGLISVSEIEITGLEINAFLEP